MKRNNNTSQGKTSRSVCNKAIQSLKLNASLMPDAVTDAEVNMQSRLSRKIKLQGMTSWSVCNKAV